MNNINEIRIKYPKNSPEYFRIYYEQNKTQIAERVANYYDNNKKRKIDAYTQNKDLLLEKVQCECGHFVSKCHLLRHCRTNKHLNNTMVRI